MSMKAACSVLLAAALLSACSEQPALRTEHPAQLVEDLARSLIGPARDWLEEEQSREEDLTLGHPSSAETVMVSGRSWFIGHAAGTLAVTDGGCQRAMGMTNR